MESKRPRGRQKRVSSGESDVFKKGEQKTDSSPVGNSGGYSNRPDFTNNNGSGGQQNNRPRVTRGKIGGGGILIILIVLALLIFGRRCNTCNNSGNSTQILNQQSTQNQQNSDYDTQDILSQLFGLQSVQTTEDTSEEEYEYVEEEAEEAEEEVEEPEQEVETYAGIVEEEEVETEVDDKARERYTTLKGNGKDTVTIMVFMCGTDLEQKYGMGTSDLQEMLNAKLSDKVKIVVETGGCSKWNNNVVSASTNQRYLITSSGMQCIEKNLGKKAMVDPNTLTDFIQYCNKNYPADRNILIMWDHGGGSITGYGYDQVFVSKGSMALDKFYSALDKAGCKFDFIGFDACLMASLETAVASEPYADYMIASEETEPGQGWYYTDWLTTLSKNTSTPTVDIGKQIIDDYCAVSARESASSVTTLSLTDLAEFSGTVPKALAKFAQDAIRLVDSDSYKQVSNARANVREFSSSNRLDQIDLIDFAKKVGTDASNEFAEVLGNCIKYNRTSRSMTNAYGISTYFPYASQSKVSSALNIYDNIGMDENYSSCVKSFASILTGGQVLPSSFGYSGSGSLFGSLLEGYGSSASSSGSDSLFGSSGMESLFGASGMDSLFGSSTGSSSSSYGMDMSDLLGAFLGGSGDFSSMLGGRSADWDWVDTDLIDRNIERIARDNELTSEAFTLTNINGRTVLDLTDEQWDVMNSSLLNVLLDDGEGFIDLGLDNIYDYDEYGNLICEYDGTWLSFNGQIVPYYYMSMEEDGDAYCIKGYVPAEVNGDLSHLILVFDDQNPYGYIAGYYSLKNGVVSKLADLVKGDKLDFVCDYYDYDGNFTANYNLGDTFVYGGDVEISNIKISAASGKPSACYRFVDIYNNEYWSETF